MALFPAVFRNTLDAGEPLDIALPMTAADLIRYDVPETGGPFITGAPQSNVLKGSVLLSPLAPIAANTLSDPMTAADVLLFKEVSASETSGIETFQGLQIVGEHDHGNAGISGAQTIPTGIDFSICSIIEIEVMDSAQGHRSLVHAPTNFPLATTNGALLLWYDVNYLRLYFASEAARSAGDMRIDLIGTENLRIGKIRGLAYAENKVVTPVSTTVRDQVTVTANAGALTVNEMASAVGFTGTSMRMRVPIPAGQEVATVAADNGCSASVADSRAGAIELAIPIGTVGATDVTVTFVASDAAYIEIPEFTQDAGSWFASGLDDLELHMGGATDRQLYIRFTTRRVLKIIAWYSQLKDSGDIASGSFRHSVDLAPNTSLRVWDTAGFNFTNVGQTFYARMTDETTRVEYMVSYTTQSGHLNNDVRVAKYNPNRQFPWPIA